MKNWMKLWPERMHVKHLHGLQWVFVVVKFVPAEAVIH
jgi:hypothetical protein